MLSAVMINVIMVNVLAPDSFKSFSKLLNVFVAALQMPSRSSYSLLQTRILMKKCSKKVSY
jgi:hypothetical protein